MPKRHTAYKLTIPHILASPLKEDEVGKHIVVKNIRARRVHTYGRVVRVFLDTEQQLGFFDVEDLDGSGAKISVRFFGDGILRASGIQEGELVRVIGKPRVYKGERFIQGEVIRPTSLLEAELIRAEAVVAFGEPPAVNAKDEGDLTEEEKRVLEFIRQNQGENGVKYITLIRELRIDENTLDEILDNLSKMGEIYEPKIGKFKTVE